MNISYRLLLISSIVMTLTSCHMPKALKSDDKAYLQAANTPPLRIPAGMSSEKIHNFYPVSEPTQATLKNDVSIIPPGL